MFELQSCVRYGGITLELAHGSDTSSFTVDITQRVIKWTAPNLKGAFEWKMVASMRYEELESGRGLLSVTFGEAEERLAGRTRPVGIIDESCWRQIAAAVEDDIAMVGPPTAR